MRTPENRLLPMSCIAAMLVVTTTIVGLAYWVGDAMAPGFASVVGASIRDAFPQTPVVVLSGEDDPRMIRATIEHGAMGFVPKSSTPEILIQALRLILAHGVYLPMSALDSDEPRGSGGSTPADPDSLLRAMSPRQIEVLHCVIQGQPNKLIARKLALSESTVKAHLSAVFRSLGARNRTEAVYAAAKLGLRLV